MTHDRDLYCGDEVGRVLLTAARNVPTVVQTGSGSFSGYGKGWVGWEKGSAVYLCDGEKTSNIAVDEKRNSCNVLEATETPFPNLLLIS